jgi:hypothetical protein
MRGVSGAGEIDDQPAVHKHEVQGTFWVTPPSAAVEAACRATYSVVFISLSVSRTE